MALQRACSTSDVDVASAIAIDLENLFGEMIPVCIARDSDGTWHALGDTCTHADVSLSEGDVDEGSIECWKHGALFDLASGKPLSLPATKPVPVYDLRIEGTDVLVDVDAAK